MQAIFSGTLRRNITIFGLTLAVCMLVIMAAAAGQAHAYVFDLSPTGTIPNGNTTITATFEGYPDGPSIYLDGSLLGSCGTTYNDPDGRWTSGWYAYVSCPVSGLSNGTHTYRAETCHTYMDYCDAGFESETETFCVGACSSDTTPPVTTDNAPAGWQNHNVTVTLSCSDAGGSGCASTTYEVNGGATQTGNSVTVSTNGTHTITYRSTDNAGNTETSKNVTVQIDKTAPVLSLPGNITAEASDSVGAVVTFSVTATDPDDAAGPVACSPLASGAKFPMGSTTETCTVTDSHGNSSSGTFTVTVVDTSAPAVAYTGPSGTISSSNPTVTGTATDSASAMVYGAMSLNGGPETSCSLDGSGNISCPTSGLADGAYSAVITVTDAAGNTGSASGSFVVDTCVGEQPSLGLSMTGSSWASYADYTAGLLSVGYQVANGGSSAAFNVAIVGSSNTNGVTLASATPVVVGDIAAGGNATSTVKYHVPAGVVWFKSSVYATAADVCGASYSYPGPMPVS